MSMAHVWLEDGQSGGTFYPALLVKIDDDQRKYGGCLHSIKHLTWPGTSMSLGRTPGSLQTGSA